MKSQKFPKSQMLASVWVDKGRLFLLFSVWDHSWRSQWCLSLSKSKQSFTRFPTFRVSTTASWSLCVRFWTFTAVWRMDLTLAPRRCWKTVAKGQTIHLRTSVALKSSKLLNQRNHGAHQRRQREGFLHHPCGTPSPQTAPFRWLKLWLGARCFNIFF